MLHVCSLPPSSGRGVWGPPCGKHGKIGADHQWNKESSREVGPTKMSPPTHPRIAVEAKGSMAGPATREGWKHVVGSFDIMLLRLHDIRHLIKESTHLTFADVAVDNLTSPSMLRVHLKALKTDPFNAGVDIVVGKAGNALCPVVAVVNYHLIRGSGPEWKATYQSEVGGIGTRSIVESGNRWRIIFRA